MSAESTLKEAQRHYVAAISHRQKQRHLLSLSEVAFRDHIVRPLFILQGYTDRSETCGPMEYGKDAYFTKPAPFGAVELTVIQTKKGRITKSSSPSENLHTIIAQLKTALETPVPLVPELMNACPFVAFLVASGNILPAARGYIVDELKSPHIRFLDGEDLIRYIDDLMPEIWNNVDPHIMPFKRALVRALENGSDVLPGATSIIPGTRGDEILDSIYADVQISPIVRRETKGRRVKKGSIPRPAQFSLTSVINRSEALLLITGDGGSGKSTALRRIAYELARKPIESLADVRIPIIISAKALSAPDTSLLDAAAAFVRKLEDNILIPFGPKDLAEGRLAILIDALDEVGTDDLRILVLDKVRTFNEQYPRCKIIMTSRNDDFTRAASALKAFTRFYVSPLEIRQAVALIRSYLREGRLGEADSASVMHTLQHIHGVTLSPLIVAVFLTVSQKARVDAPANVTELFKKYTEVMLGRWDRDKGLEQQMNTPLKDALLMDLAFELHKNKPTEFPIDDFRSYVKTYIAKLGVPEDPEEISRELLDRSGLLRCIEDRVEFRHQVLQEFFAGRAIDELANRAGFMSEKLSEDWWKRPIVFFSVRN